ncbi:conserved protein, unknown function [Plasmodium ovale curtisi]|uniref:U4/U6.U5 small nuclear ribonucleoprotein 27kDa protein domain-containing protein n=2 Tax=Plasmodium ovale TaxID=36330 RepID=A0A1A8WNN0_PLAOA|nr:conserved protein, unknown function [Plasmodium ovale curtisi]
MFTCRAPHTSHIKAPRKAKILDQTAECDDAERKVKVKGHGKKTGGWRNTQNLRGKKSRRRKEEGKGVEANGEAAQQSILDLVYKPKEEEYSTMFNAFFKIKNKNIQSVQSESKHVEANAKDPDVTGNSSHTVQEEVRGGYIYEKSKSKEYTEGEVINPDCKVDEVIPLNRIQNGGKKEQANDYERKSSGSKTAEAIKGVVELGSEESDPVIDTIKKAMETETSCSEWESDRGRRRGRSRGKGRSKSRSRSRSRGKGRSKSRSRSRSRGRHRDRHRHRSRERHRHRKRDRSGERRRHRKRDGSRGRSRDRGRDKSRDRDRDRDRRRHRHRHRHKRRDESRGRRSSSSNRGSILSSSYADNRKEKRREYSSMESNGIGNDTSVGGNRCVGNIKYCEPISDVDSIESENEYVRNKRMKRSPDRNEQYVNVENKQNNEPPYVKNNKPNDSDTSNESEREEDLSEGELLKKIMGISEFATSENKCHNQTDMSGINRRTKRKYRQYMNRRGGFNRPLSPAF